MVRQAFCIGVGDKAWAQNESKPSQSLKGIVGMQPAQRFSVWGLTDRVESI